MINRIARLDLAGLSRHALKGLLMRRAGLLNTASVLLPLALTACAENHEAGQMPDAGVSVITLATESTDIGATLPGRTRAYETAEIRPQVGGIVRKRLFDEGADVRAGDPLYLIDPAPLEAELASAQAAQAEARAALRAAEIKDERFGLLRSQDAVSQQEADDAAAAHQQAAASVSSSEANLKKARINLDFATVRAPISGRVGASAVTVGALVSADQSDALTTVTRLDPIYVDVSQSSSSLLALRRQLASGGLKQVDGKAQVRVSLEDGSLHPQAGTLEVNGVVVSEATGTVGLRAVVPNPGNILLPGMYVQASIPFAVDERAILIPQQAVARNAKGQATTMVVTSESVVEQRVLQLSNAIGNRWIVVEGVKAGERVIMEGASKVRPGAKVKASPFDEGATKADGGSPASAPARPDAPRGSEA